jgi:RNA polymerase sigma-70 factor (ECF subfamily)
LYDLYSAGLYRYALVVLMDHGLAEDAVHQVFSKLLSLGLERIEEPQRYLRRSVRNECLTLRERRPSMAERPVLEAIRTEAFDGDDRMAIEAALRELPIEQREVVVLKVYEGLTFKEIAEVTGAPLNTVASRYRYALDRLRSTFQVPECAK